jgi:hypothetical protein
MAYGQLAVALPRVGRMAMQALPYIIGGSAAYRPFMEGRPLEAAIQGGLGFLGGKGIQGPLTGVASRAMAQGPRVAGLVGQPGLAGPITKGLGLAVPAAAIALTPQIAGALVPGASGAVQQGLGGAAQLGAGALGYQAPGAPQYGGAPYNPTDMYGNITPSGLPTEVLGAPGMGRRLEQLKSAETARDAMRLLNPEIYAAGEAREKQNFARQMAAAGIRQNIATRAAMLQNAQLAGLNMGATALQQAGNALTSHFQYQ